MRWGNVGEIEDVGGSVMFWAGRAELDPPRQAWNSEREGQTSKGCPFGVIELCTWLTDRNFKAPWEAFSSWALDQLGYECVTEMF